MHARRPRRRDRRPGARAQLGVLGDKRAVEVGRERLDLGGEVRREDQPFVAWETYAATSAICFGESWPLNDGMTPLPFVTRSITSDAGGFF